MRSHQKVNAEDFLSIVKIVNICLNDRIRTGRCSKRVCGSVAFDAFNRIQARHELRKPSARRLEHLARHQRLGCRESHEYGLKKLRKTQSSSVSRNEFGLMDEKNAELALVQGLKDGDLRIESTGAMRCSECVCLSSNYIIVVLFLYSVVLSLSVFSVHGREEA